MRLALMLLVLLVWPGCAFALVGTLFLAPRDVVQGGVAVLTWEGEQPAAAMARCNGRTYPLRPVPFGASALLGVDLELPPGRYPVEVELTDDSGRREIFRIQLDVKAVERATERLDLPPAMVSPTDPAVQKRIVRERQMLERLYARHDTPPLWGGFSLPVDDQVGSPFGLRRILNGKPRSPHAGVDFRSPAGTPVRASATGRVVYAGDLYFTGRTVILDHGAGFFSLYAHLQRSDCREGEVVRAGEVIGRVGSSGRSTGAHLHWGIRLQGDRIDPLALVALSAGEKR